jgi:hypothetical protein
MKHYNVALKTLKELIISRPLEEYIMALEQILREVGDLKSESAIWYELAFWHTSVFARYHEKWPSSLNILHRRFLGSLQHSVAGDRGLGMERLWRLIEVCYAGFRPFDADLLEAYTNVIVELRVPTADNAILIPPLRILYRHHSDNRKIATLLAEILSKQQPFAWMETWKTLLDQTPSELIFQVGLKRDLSGQQAAGLEIWKWLLERNPNVDLFFNELKAAVTTGHSRNFQISIWKEVLSVHPGNALFVYKLKEVLGYFDRRERTNLFRYAIDRSEQESFWGATGDAYLLTSRACNGDFSDLQNASKYDNPNVLTQVLIMKGKSPMPLTMGDAFVRYRKRWQMKDRKINKYLEAHNVWRELHKDHPESLFITFELARVELLIQFLLGMVDLEKYYEPVQNIKTGLQRFIESRRGRSPKAADGTIRSLRFGETVL